MSTKTRVIVAVLMMFIVLTVLGIARLLRPAQVDKVEEKPQQHTTATEKPAEAMFPGVDGDTAKKLRDAGFVEIAPVKVSDPKN